jgi:hypothetical protein
LRVLDTPLAADAIESRLRQSGCPPADDDVEGQLDRLLERRLVWRSSTQYVALPTTPPCRPPARESIGGEIRIARYLRDHAAPPPRAEDRR